MTAALPLATQAQARAAMGGRGPSGPSRFGSAAVPSARPAPSFRGGFAGGGGIRTGRPFVPAPRPGFRSAPGGFRGGGRFAFGDGRFRFDRFRFGRFGRFDRFRDPFIFSGGCIHGAFFGGFPCRHFFFNNAFVWGYAPYFADYSYPYYPYSSYSDTSYAQPQQNAAADNGNANLAYEVGRLSTEVEQLREEERTRAEERSQTSAAPAPPAKTQPAIPVTLVFRDGHRVTVKNYAVVSNTIWILNEHTARKVLLSDLDLAATQRVNDENGAELHLPVASPPR